ncbi:hypothetical protein ACJX0J_037667, partial [Zea mays]
CIYSCFYSFGYIPLQNLQEKWLEKEYFLEYSINIIWNMEKGFYNHIMDIFFMHLLHGENGPILLSIKAFIKCCHMYLDVEMVAQYVFTQEDIIKCCHTQMEHFIILCQWFALVMLYVVIDYNEGDGMTFRGSLTTTDGLYSLFYVSIIHLNLMMQSRITDSKTTLHNGHLDYMNNYLLDALDSVICLVSSSIHIHNKINEVVTDIVVLIDYGFPSIQYHCLYICCPYTSILLLRTWSSTYFHLSSCTNNYYSTILGIHTSNILCYI